MVERYRHNIFAFCLFLVLTIVASWPILADLDGVIIGRDPDVYINPWADWWSLKAWQDSKTDLFYTDYLFYPDGGNLTYHSFSHLNTILSLALQSFLAPLPAYNITILFNFVLNGFATFQLTFYLTRSIPASILAGITFAFNCHSLYQSAHPVLTSIWCLPWLTLYFMRAVRENSLKWSILSALFIGLGTATSTLLFILIGLWMILLVIYLFLSSEWPRPSWRVLLTVGIVSFFLCLPFFYPLVYSALFSQNTSFLIASMATVETDMVFIAVPHWYIWFEGSVYFGIVPIALLLLAFGFQRRQARLWFILLILAYLFAIGPYPRTFYTPLGITLPWSLLVSPLLRNTNRMNILIVFGLALLVAYGWIAFESLLKRGNKWKTIAAIVLAGGIFVEYTVLFIPYTPIHVSPFYTDFLETVPDDVALATLPIGRQQGKKFLFYQTLHEHRITGGVISRASAETFEFMLNNPLLRAGMVDLPPAPIPNNISSAIRALARANIGYVVFDKTLMKADDIARWRNAFPMPPYYEDKWVLVYATGLDFRTLP